MVDVDFELIQPHFIIKANLEEPFQDAINKYFQRIVPRQEYFKVNGKQVDPKASVERHMSELDQEEKKLKVSVNMNKKIKNQNK